MAFVEACHRARHESPCKLRVLRPGGWLAVSQPIDLDIAMHSTVIASEQEIVAYFAVR